MKALSRREFLGRTGGFAAAAVCGSTLLAAEAGKAWDLPLVVFSKIYQELKFDFEQAADLTAEAGLQGVDCPVRPGGEILPERAADELPRYAGILGKRNLSIPLLTTGITSVSSPHTETILRTAKKVGVRHYRLGFAYHNNSPISDQIRASRAQLRELAALNKEVGIGALLQNHSPSGKSTYLAGDLGEMRELVEGFDPAQVGVAFDIGHALLVHGENWRGHFEALKPHLKIAYLKDAKRGGRFVPFGQGDIASSGYFKLLKQTGYTAPISMHIEFDWADPDRKKNRAALLKALRESAAVTRQWLAEA